MREWFQKLGVGSHGKEEMGKTHREKGHATETHLNLLL